MAKKVRKTKKVTHHKRAKHKKSVKHKPSFSVKKQHIIAAVLIVLLIFVFSMLSQEAVAKVGEEKIYSERVDALYNSLPEGSQLTKNDILSRLIDSEVFLNYIKSKGFTLPEEQIQSMFEKRLEESGLTQEAFEAELDLRGATFEDVKDNFLIEKFVEQEIISKINIGVKDLDLYRDLQATEGLTDAQLTNVIFIARQKQITAAIISQHAKTLEIEVYKDYSEQ